MELLLTVAGSIQPDTTILLILLPTSLSKKSQLSPLLSDSIADGLGAKSAKATRCADSNGVVGSEVGLTVAEIRALFDEPSVWSCDFNLTSTSKFGKLKVVVVRNGGGVNNDDGGPTTRSLLATHSEDRVVVSGLAITSVEGQFTLSKMVVVVDVVVVVSNITGATTVVDLEVVEVE